MSNFPIERQNRLHPLMEALRKLPGIEAVQSDDWDSVSIRVHLYLKHPSKFLFEQPLNSTSRRIKNVCRRLGIGYITTLFPEMKRSYSGMWQGRAEYHKEGYTGFVVSIDVDV